MRRLHYLHLYCSCSMFIWMHCTTCTYSLSRLSEKTRSQVLFQTSEILNFFLHTVWASSITMPQVSMRLSLMLLDASMQCHAACLCVWVCVVCDCSLFVYGLGTFVAVGCRFKYILQARRHTPHILRHCCLVKPYPAYMLWIATYTALSSSVSTLLCFAGRTASNTFRKTIVVQNFQLDDAIERIVSPNDDGLCACRHRRQCVEHTFVMHVGKGDDATDPTPPYSTE